MTDNDEPTVTVYDKNGRPIVVAINGRAAKRDGLQHLIDTGQVFTQPPAGDDAA